MATTDDKIIFVDTNVLTRATISSAPLHVEAKALLETLWQEKAQLWISRQVLREYIANATRPQAYSAPIPIPLLEQQLHYFIQQFRVADETVEVTNQLLQLIKTISTGGKQVHDANIVATMLVNQIPTLLTHNVTDFDRFKPYISILPLT